MANVFIGSGNNNITSISLMNQACLIKEQTTTGQTFSFKTEKRFKSSLRLRFFACFLKNFLSNNIFGTNIFKFRVSGVAIGRYCVLQHIVVIYRISMRLFIYFAYFFICINLTAIYSIFYLKLIQLKLFIPHDPSYMYGILCEYAVKYNITVYHNRYPYRVISSLN